MTSFPKATRTSRPRLAAITIVALTMIIMIIASPCLAQDDGPGGRRGFRGPRSGGSGGAFGQLFRPEFLRRDLPLIAGELELDKSQSTIVETLLLDYQAAFDDGAEGIRDEFRELRPQSEGRQERLVQRRELNEKMREVREKVRALRQAGEEIDPEVLAEVRQEMAPIREKLAQLGPQMPQGQELTRMTEGFASLAREWGRTRAQLKAEFLANLRALLTEEQAERLPAVERWLRREKSLQRGRFSGESVNLFLVLRELDVNLDDLPSLQALLEEYAVVLDQAFIARDELLDSGRGQMIQAAFGGDVDRAMSIYSREADLRVAVRSVTDRYVELVTAWLAENVSEELAEQVRGGHRDRAYSRIFRRTRMQRAFETAKAIDGLDEDVLASIVSLEASYLVDLDMKNTKIVAATRKHEPLEAGQRLQRRAARLAGEAYTRPDSPIRAAFRERSELDDRYRKELEALLTPEQVALLPAARRQRERDGEGRFGRDRRRGRDEASRAQRRERMLERFDADGDGELSEAERETLRETMREERRARQLERFDLDGDGELSDAERETMRQERRGRGRDRRSGPEV